MKKQTKKKTKEELEAIKKANEDKTKKLFNGEKITK